MATISHSDQAPKGTIHYLLGNAEFDLSAKKSFETDDAAVIADANVHPWMVVTHPDDPEGSIGKFAPQLAPEDDHLSFINDMSNVPVETTDAEVENPTPLDPEEASDTPVADEASDNSDEKDQS